MPAEKHPPLAGCIAEDALQLAWSEAPWDTAVFGAPVLQVTGIQVRDARKAAALMPRFEAARDAAGSPFASCRLPHDCLRESMFLEQHGFRFIEMLFQPEFPDLQQATLAAPGGLTVHGATDQDLAWAVEVAGQAFANERFHVDPRLPRGLGDRRYQNWVRSSLGHARQRLLVIREGRDAIAFFIVEQLEDGTCYWHLTAVAPDKQGQGYGARVWATMLAHARDAGASRIRTSVVARNHRVLNLYGRLRFRLSAPAMTFHWLRET
ncbi:MAG TPA: GNAT family N-acetyltransferase [Ramlibacter sp.]